VRVVAGEGFDKFAANERSGAMSPASE
jgi:hypothetical protein